MADSSRWRQGVCGEVIHPRCPPPLHARMAADRCRGGAIISAHTRARTVRMPGNRVDRAMSLPAGRSEPRVRSWGLTKKRERTERHVRAGESADGSGPTACIAALLLRERRRNQDMHDTTVEKRGDYRHAGA